MHTTQDIYGNKQKTGLFNLLHVENVGPEFLIFQRLKAKVYFVVVFVVVVV